MSVHRTVVFTDLFGSTSVFEALGNAKATQAVTQVTTWIAKVIQAHGGAGCQNAGRRCIGAVQ